MTGFLLLVSIAATNMLMVIVFYLRAVRHSRVLPSELLESLATENSLCTLHYRKRRRVAAWALFLIVEGYPSIQILSDWSMFNNLSADGVAAFTCLAVVISALGWYYLLEVYGVSHLVARAGLVRRNAFSRTILLGWEDIDSVSFNRILGTFTVRSRVGRLSVSSVLDGLDRFSRGILDCLPEDRFRNSRQHLDRALSGPFQP